jgi:hydrogenase expression/formation protein HypD
MAPDQEVLRVSMHACAAEVLNKMPTAQNHSASFHPDRVKSLVEAIKKEASRLDKPPKFMEVCGTHTVAIFRNGIRELLEGYVELISGPGCPVCVTPDSLIDRAIAYASQGCVVGSFGDMLRVPGTESSLLAARAGGARVTVVTSPLEMVGLAKANPTRDVLFFAVGFETTAPGTALLLEQVIREDLPNLKIIPGHKVIPPALEVLLNAPSQNISGFLCPGHVSSIIGIKPYFPISRKYRVPCVVTGFEAADILEAVLMLVRQLNEGRYETENQYRRGVRPEGNPKAQALLEQYFVTGDTEWRGFGMMEQSGLLLRQEYQVFDAVQTLPVELPPPRSLKGCKCGEVLRGEATPDRCGLFGRECTPQSPVGPCMVSGEGVCLTYYRYRAE